MQEHELWKRRWTQWYDIMIKKDSKTIEEELEKCKNWLEHFWIGTKPVLFYDIWEEPAKWSEFRRVRVRWEIEQWDPELGLRLWIVREPEESDIKEILCDLPRIGKFLSLGRCVSLYKQVKDRFEFEKLEHALHALRSVNRTIQTPESQKLLQLENTRWKSLLREEHWKSLNDEQRERAVREHMKALDEGGEACTGILKEFKLEILRHYHSQLETTMNGAVSLALLGNVTTSAMLLRPFLEVALKCMLFQYLSSYRFQRDIERNWNTREGRAVGKFLDAVRDKARASERARLEDVLSSPEQLEDMPLLTIEHIIFWLNKWGVFQGIPDFPEKTHKIFDFLNGLIHGGFRKEIFDEFYEEENVVGVLETIIQSIDITLVGILNTAREFNDGDALRKALNKEILLGPKDEDILRSKWQEFIEHIKKGDLKMTERTLKIKWMVMDKDTAH